MRLDRRAAAGRRPPAAAGAGRHARTASRSAATVRYEIVTDTADRVAAAVPPRRPRQLPAHGARRNGRRADLADARERPAQRHPARAVVAGTHAARAGQRRRSRHAAADPLQIVGRLPARLHLRAGLRGRGADRAGPAASPPCATWSRSSSTTAARRTRWRGNGKPAITRAHGFGVSQSGRFLRHFLYQGFNADEKDRKVFDGLMPHVAGGGLGFFNHRFAQPTRHNGQHEEHLYPADIFPFTYGDQNHELHQSAEPVDSESRSTASCRRGAAVAPKVMHTQSAAEYWHRSGSLVHTDPSGNEDASIPDNVRIYAFGGTQHGPARDPPKRGNGDNLPNPGDYGRSAGAARRPGRLGQGRHAAAGSVYPRIDEGTLVDWKQTATGFPALPGVRYPEVIQQPSFSGSTAPTSARRASSPSSRRGARPLRVLVPQSRPDGNDLGTLLPPEVAVPLATYTGWNLRKKTSAPRGCSLICRGHIFHCRALKRTASRRAIHVVRSRSSITPLRSTRSVFKRTARTTFRSMASAGRCRSAHRFPRESAQCV